MAHADRLYRTLPKPPPTCPQCGNHRTQIVGLADDGGMIVVRCTVCGARSELKTAPASEPR